MATAHRAGALIEELLISGVLTVDDVAGAVGVDVTDHLAVDVEGDTVTITA